MDAAEYDLPYFHRTSFRRRTCEACGAAFWTLGEHRRCQEAPCVPYGFIGHSPFDRPRSARAMRETFLTFFERRGHERLRRYPVVARWRNDVFFTQASIYDFQPYVTSGAVPPPANPLTLSQPCLRFVDLDEVGQSGRHFTLFEMMAHHAFNRPDHEVYFKDRCVELCHELLTSELGADPASITYKEEVWEGGGNLGPSMSVGLAGVELATLVFMEYRRRGETLEPMPLTVVDTGYGLERFTWVSQGTKTAYEAVFAGPYDELRQTASAPTASILIDHARALNFLLTDGVVPSNAKEGYFARLLIRRSLRLLEKLPEAPTLPAILGRVGRELAVDFPEIGEHRDDLDRVVNAEVERYRESIGRARDVIRRHEERVRARGGRVTSDDLVGWYDSLGVPPDVAVESLVDPPAIPPNFYAQVAARHESEPTARQGDHEPGGAAPPVPPEVPPTRVRYYLDPYTHSFEAHVVWSHGPFVALDETYFYPTGGGQVTDTGELGGSRVVEVLGVGPVVVHRLEAPRAFSVGERVHGRIDVDRRRQLMQHHTATHLLNGALRQVLGPHVWQTGAYKGPEIARLDVTHYAPLTRDEARRVERLANRIVRENRPVKSYFAPRTEAERRFGFTLYQGGAVPGRELRIVEIEGFDVEACGGTHCTHTSEVGAIALLDVDRIQDGVIRLSFASGERALDLRDEHETILRDSARKIGVPPEELPAGIDRLLAQLNEARHAVRARERDDLAQVADRLLGDPAAARSIGPVRVVHGTVDADRDALVELSRRLTKPAPAVAILASERDGRGLLFIGSTAPGVSAERVIAAAKPIFQAKGGGSPAAATAVGEPGEPLRAALRAAVAEAEAAAGRAP